MAPGFLQFLPVQLGTLGAFDTQVAVIGSGASAVQVVPAIAGEVEELWLFQRTPNWILPKSDRAFRRMERAAFHRLPFARKLYRILLYAVFESRVIAFRCSTNSTRLRIMTAHMRSPFSRVAFVGSPRTPDIEIRAVRACQVTPPGTCGTQNSAKSPSPP